MQNPKDEIAGIVGVLTSTVDRKLLRDTIKNNFTEDASIDHPLCIIKSSAGSRQKLLGAYEWYRILSPHTKSRVESVGEHPLTTA
ncbi:hypothetical protein SERLA73DRAFT_124339 [Serpula lacrymans var. lacrymans S7.3]|uniref:SigF-like NTF2-like domain-containing protein n=2 Tax=Serpula lacrymans var. lacrymans TaxID=341189 RepID=F8Q3E4_SERL3|nr:uncharacterized protein SERLADRAFT_394540 [Serpula lacrymans var. lacrymans S7.9]EGN97705.1 hypothetical protein SERLA73DRAFT_124339 [Serpula lacrymans var. lacrymans S7.3]EGO23296.1 hypothetical protein SERLADRAFT_394540 [Serpula lacrymans var. lacrymans S7.9]